MAPVAEIICVGTELLLGDILNSNAQFLAKELAKLGIAHYYQSVVGDNPERIQQVVKTACDRASLLIFTGGLGPTPDDLTHATLAACFEVPMIEHPEILADIAQKFAQRGRTMTPNNYKQALLPDGAQVLSNSGGSAPGIIWQPRPNVTILTFPGVPTEVKYMWQDVAIPYLKRQGWAQNTVYSRILRFWGISESVLADKVGDWFNSTNPTVAPYANLGEVKLRISAFADSEASAQQMIAPVEATLRQVGGIDCYGSDDDTLAIAVGRLLQQTGSTVSVAESCTGGSLGAMLTTVAGSSAYFWGGIISYDNSVKVDLLGVDPQVLVTHGAVSHEVAKQMAVGVRDRLNTTWGLSITGIAGPTGNTDEKPVGLVYIGLAGRDRVESFEHHFGALRGREWVRHLSCCTALDYLRRRLTKAEL